MIVRHRKDNSMKLTLSRIFAILAVVALTGCATAAGTAVGAGIGSVAGDTKTGAVIGGSVGLLYDVFD